MPIKSIITDLSSGLSAQVVDGIKTPALVVATRPLKIYEHKSLFFTNDTYGTSMNQNVTFGGTPDQVHHGTDDILWTASAISGTWDFASTTQAHAGTKSIDGIATVNTSTAQIAKGSELTLSDYTALTGWIYITAWDTRGTKSVDIYGWDVDTGTQQGSRLGIGNYVSTTILNSWQKFAIPLEDFSITSASIDSIRISVVDIGPGAAPNYYLDDIQFEETGSPATFKITPENGQWLQIPSIKITMADAMAGTLADGTMPALAYNKLLAVNALSSGIIYQRIVDGVVESSNNFKQLSDFLLTASSRLQDYFSDGTNTFISIVFSFGTPIILKYETEDSLRIIVQEDLSGLLLFKASAQAIVDQRQ